MSLFENSEIKKTNNQLPYQFFTKQFKYLFCIIKKRYIKGINGEIIEFYSSKGKGVGGGLTYIYLSLQFQRKILVHKNENNIGYSCAKR